VAGLELGCAILHYEKTMNHWSPGSALMLLPRPRGRHCEVGRPLLMGDWRGESSLADATPTCQVGALPPLGRSTGWEACRRLLGGVRTWV